jgi:predicted ABC-type ATPase
MGSTRKNARRPRCIVIAGPNGAGKTTLAREFLKEDAGVIRFVNADLIAAGLSPLDPKLAALQAGKILLAEIDRLSAARLDFAFETTLSGIAHAARLKSLRDSGYEIILIFIGLTSAKLALRRVAERVQQGGHSVPKADVIRRFERGLRNFESVYRQLADSWAVYDNSGESPRLMGSEP